MIKNKVSLMKLDFHRLHETNKSQFLIYSFFYYILEMVYLKKIYIYYNDFFSLSPQYISRNNNTGPSAAIITPNSTLPQVITVNSSEPSHLNSHNLNSTHNGLSTLSPSHNGLSSSHNAMNSSLQSHNSHCVRPELSVAIPPETCRQITGRCSTSPPMTGQ